MKCVKCFLMEDLTGALFLGHFYICAWCILAAPSRTAWQAACSSCLCLCAPLLLLVGQVLFLRDLSVPVECPSPRYLSSSQHALSCMHKGRILFQGRQQTVPRLFSVCDAAGRLSAARPVCVCVEGPRFAVPPIPAEVVTDLWAGPCACSTSLLEGRTFCLAITGLELGQVHITLLERGVGSWVWEPEAAVVTVGAVTAVVPSGVASPGAPWLRVALCVFEECSCAHVWQGTEVWLCRCCSSAPGPALPGEG